MGQACDAMNDSPAARAFGEWSVESFRLTLFHTMQPSPQGLWHALMNIEPESHEAKPRQFVTIDQGPLGPDRLVLETQRQRLGWHVLPAPPGVHDNAATVLKLLGVEQGIDLLQKALSTTLQHIPVVTRLALGAVLFRVTKDPRDAVAQITSHIPKLEAAVKGGTDLIFQINRRRRSNSVPHVVINRIHKWTVEQFQSGAFLVSTSQAPVFQQANVKHLAKFTLDINTAPENNAISSKKMSSLLTEFIEYARVAALNGDAI